METTKQGIWMNYPSNDGYRDGENDSYQRLYRDLKDFDTGWSASKDEMHCYKVICGAPVGCGESAYDVYVYYESDENSKPVPKIYMETSSQDGKNFASVIYGTKIPLAEWEQGCLPNQEIDAELLEVLVAKLRELDIRPVTIDIYEQKLSEYKKLCEIQSRGITTSEDLLTLYSNFYRRDTTIAKDFIKGRNIRADFDSLSREDKIRFLTVLAGIERLTTPKKNLLKSFVGIAEDEELLEISDESLIIESATSTWLRCLIYATPKLKANRDFIIRVLENFKINHKNCTGFRLCIPQEFRNEIEILTLATKSAPYMLYNAINDSMITNVQNDPHLAAKLLDAHLRNTIVANENTDDPYIDLRILWDLTDAELAYIEDMVLYGPEPTRKREALKSEIGRRISLERKQIQDYRNRKQEN